MIKKFSMLALAGLIALPGMAAASAGKTPTDLEQRIDELSRQLDELRAQLAQQNEELAEVGDQVGDIDDMLYDKSEGWDLAARIRLYGDFRSRLDFMKSETAPQYTVSQVAAGFNSALAAPPSMGGFGFPGPYPTQFVQMAVRGFKQYTPEQRAGLFAQLGHTPVGSYPVNSDTLMTNRFRLNMEVRATEFVTFK